MRQPVEERPGEGCNGKHCPHDDVHVGDDEKSIADKRLLANLQRVRSKKEEFLDEASFLIIGVVFMQPPRLLAKSATCSIKNEQILCKGWEGKIQASHCFSAMHPSKCNYCIMQPLLGMQPLYFATIPMQSLRCANNAISAYCRYLLNIALCIRCAQCSLCELSFALYAVQWSAL